MRSLDCRTYVLALVPADKQIELIPDGTGTWFTKIPRPRSSLPPIEVSAVDHMDDALLGPAPELLTVFESPADHWLETRLSTEPPRIHSGRMGLTGEVIGRRVVEIIDKGHANPSIVTVDVPPIP